jgi:hypothetical protein
MVTKPKRISMGCYAVEKDGQQVVLQRVGRRGFKIVQRPGAIAPVIKRLRDAARIALENLSPSPFTVPMEPHD